MNELDEAQSEKEIVGARLRISGRVQGVCFRAYTRAEAQRLGTRGLVRNLRDGGVEVLVEHMRKGDAHTKEGWNLLFGDGQYQRR